MWFMGNFAMSNAFVERLRAVTQRAQAVRRNEANQLQEQTEAAKTAKLNAAISEWNKRIQPAIGSVVARTNEIVRCVDLKLIPNILVAHEIAFWRRRPVRDLPVIVVTAQYDEPSSDPRAQSRRNSVQPRLEFEITPDAKLWIRARNYLSNVERALDVNQFTEKTAEDAIVEFVEAVLSKACPQARN
jgi:hypothetical protein